MMKTEKFKHDSELERKWSQPRVLRSELNPYVDPGIDCSTIPSMTDQSQAAETDVNFILKRYQQTGVLPGVNTQSLFADVSDAPSYHEAMDLVLKAQDQFMALDAHTRKKFSNDPAEFLEFAHDPKNAPELVKMGLATLAPEDPNKAILAELRASNKALSTLAGDPDPAPAGSRSPKTTKRTES